MILGNAEQTQAPAAAAVDQARDHQQSSGANVTPQASVPDSSLIAEEKVEYRDQDGNLLNEEQVSSLQGQVEFKTRYETRTKVVDAAGNIVGDGPAGGEGFAPPHPDVDREPETAVDQNEDDGRDTPATVSPGDDVEKEKSVGGKSGGDPKPASEGIGATK